jgi:hypothetical protein
MVAYGSHGDAAALRLSDRPAFKASASRRRVASMWVMTSDERAR